jgi:hypothetical protein
MNEFEAKEILRGLGIAQGEDFHALHSSQVHGLLAYAKAHKYRAPANASGSRARYFHAYVQRIANRKENPVATSRKKAPTAAQKAARAEFARIMKSGGFKKRRKNPAKIARRAPRRLGRSGANAEGPPPFPDAKFTRVKNPVSRSRSNMPKGIFIEANQDSRRIVRAKNPTHAPARYEVHVARHGIKGKLIAAFASLPDAKQYAQAWAKLHRCPAGITGRAR